MYEPAAKQKQIATELSQQQITLNADQPTAIFHVTVYNDSDRFASFQLKLMAAGVKAEGARAWYRLTPSVSSKIPAGDSTRFQVEVFDLPPFEAKFQGAIDLTVEVSSRELVGQYDRQTLRLRVDGLQSTPPNLTLIAPSIQVTPGERVAIPAEIAITGSIPLSVTITVDGLPSRWFPEGVEQTQTLSPGRPQRVTFYCHIPPTPNQAPCQTYPFQLRATGKFAAVSIPGQLQILPAGRIEFRCDPLETSIPEQLGRWLNPSTAIAQFILQFDNNSNLQTPTQVSVTEVLPPAKWPWQRGFRWPWQGEALPWAVAPEASEELEPSTPVPPSDLPVTIPPLPAGVVVDNLPPALPLGTTTVPLQIQRRLPWFGWGRVQRFAIQAHSLDRAIPLAPDTETVQITVFPVIPLWLQLLLAAVLMVLGALLWALLTDLGHRGAVNSVQFSGQGTEVLSGSDDQSVRRWRVDNRKLAPSGRFGNLNKAVRVSRYRPVNNDQIAIGFENGEIQIVNLLTGQRSRLTPDKDDRVFDLAFSRDARLLYSGHGSGLVLQWDMTQLLSDQTVPQRAFDLQFAIESMVLVDGDRHLLVGGRYNRLVLLSVNPEGRTTEPMNQTGNQTQLRTPNPEPIITGQPPAQVGLRTAAPTGQLITLPYRFPGSSTDFISSLSVAEQQPNLVAVSDTQGHISLWNLQTCLSNPGACAPVSEWMGHGGVAVRSLALSADGCFLATAADDGLVKLWPLDGQGVRRADRLEGVILERSAKPRAAVDIIQTRDGVLVTSGGDDWKVRLSRADLQTATLGDRCPALKK